MVGVRVLAVVVLSLGVGGCGSIRLPSSLMPSSLVPSALRSPSDVPAPTLNASVPTADGLAAPYREQAEQHERHGRLRQAVEARTTALAFAPNDESSRLALRRLRSRIDREVAEHLRRGWHALAADRGPDARRHFLAALALDPDSRAAHDAMRATPTTPRSEIEPKTRVVVVRPGTASEPKLRESAKPQADSNAGKMPAVITKSAPAPAPHPPLGKVTDKPEALYAAATTHLAAHRDEDAYRALAQLDRVSPGYGDSAALLRDLHARLVRHRYQDGMRLFREELLEDAIEQWRGVLALDPKHVEARRNIDQTEKMLRILAEQQKR